MEAIIIGSGIGGIATAIRLSVRGYKVTVYEANSYPGGKLSSFESEGFRFDAGPSLFTLPALVDELFELAGEVPGDHFRYSRKEIACRYFWEDGTELTAWADVQKFASEVEDKLGEPARHVEQHLEEIRKVYDRTHELFLESSLHRPGSYFNTNVINALGYIHKLHLTESMHDVAASKFRSDKLIQLFDRFATYNGSSPFKAPGILTMIPHLEHNLGTYLPEGGMIDITESLVELAKRQGVAFQYNSPVSEILVENGKATGIRSGDQAHYADIVVSNMDVVPTYRRLMPREKAPERTLRQERSSSALIFYWGIGKEFPQLDLHNIFFSSDYLREFSDIFDRKQPPEFPTIYVNISSKEVKSDAPEGKENWFVMINVPADYDQNWESYIPRIREHIIGRLSECLGEDIGSLIETEAMLTPSEIERKTSSFRGALYGASSNNTMAAYLRHPNFSRRTDHLYFVGGSVHPGGGIPLSLLSARIADQLISERE